MRKRGFLLIILAGLMLLVFCFGCSDQRDVSTMPPIHPDDWMNSRSVDFHGTVVSSQHDASSCIVCHGADFDGGEVEISCIDCHIAEGACTSCHGGIDNQTGAPPSGLESETATSDLAVGAHTAHLEVVTALSIECQTCHYVPAYILDSAHFDLAEEARDDIAELTFSGLAALPQTIWDRDSATCSDSYCHGNFSGGYNYSPVWNGANQAACGSCHDDGSNPVDLGGIHEFHVEIAAIDCAYCHAGVVDTLLGFTNASLHVNGIVDTLSLDPVLCASCHSGSGTGSCTVCHGGIDNETGAPPKGLENETATTELAVGAHSAHVADGFIAKAFDCDICHTKPDSVFATGHLDGDNIAELSFNSLSGTQAVWNRATAECSNTYCHGNFTGGYNVIPSWTGTNQAECGSCHDDGSNPTDLGGVHPFHIQVANLDCADCHSLTIDQSLNFLDNTNHVNGVVDTLTADPSVCNDCHGNGTGGCNYCHGGVENLTGAPPKGLEGETAITDLAVGAHSLHVTDGAFAVGFDCAICHIRPDSVFASGHLDADSIAEINFDILAGGSAAWDRVAEQCNNTYCHGEFIGGRQVDPIWTSIDPILCGDCHDYGAHPALLGGIHLEHIAVYGIGCEKCHSAVVDAQLNFVDLSMHVNGVVDTLISDQALCDNCHGVTQTCYTCHGGLDNLSGAPPYSLDQQTATTELSVGAHTAHVDGGDMSDGIPCESCHIVPSTTQDGIHLDGNLIAEVTFDSLAGLSSDWNRATAICQNTYCHGNFGGGYTTNAPLWNQPDQAECGSCHDDGTNPADLWGLHEYHVVFENIICYQCHTTVVDNTMSISGKANHINGSIEVSFESPNGSYVNGSCFATGCHGTESWNKSATE